MKNLVVVGDSQVEIHQKMRDNFMPIWIVDGRQYKVESVAILAALTLAKRQHQTAERLRETATSGKRRFSLL
mgnify:FL=1